MHISFNTLSFGNSQPLRFGCGKKKPCFKNVASVSDLNQQKHFDYKKEYEKTKAELEYTQRKYTVLSNVFALYLNPKFK